MPHAILKGPVTPEDIWLAFQPVEMAEGSTVFKAQEAFLSADKSQLLLRSLVVERGFAKGFFVKISTAPDGIRVGLDTLASPERTDGVKRLLGLLAWRILQAVPEATVQVTNIGELITAPKA